MGYVDEVVSNSVVPSVDSANFRTYLQRGNSSLHQGIVDLDSEVFVVPRVQCEQSEENSHVGVQRKVLVDFVNVLP